jgi:DNA-binding NarL/FixJ family response regulator
VKEPNARVLLVDDYEPWCRFVTSTLCKHPEFLMVGEASDGLTAVKKARELQPDLILLDIGLPKLNGIEAARRIRQHSINPKILFVSENSSSHILQAALDTGAGGYVVKSDAASDLLPAMRAVLQGKQFVGRRFAGHGFAQTSNTPSACAPGHVVQFYAHENHLLDNLCALFKKTLIAGESAAAVITKARRMSVEERLIAQDIEIGQARNKGRLAIFDAEETLREFMDANAPNRDRFVERLGTIVRRAEAAALVKNRAVVVFGEMVAVLWAQKKYEAAVRLEELWNELKLTHSFYLCCAYPASLFHGQSNEESYATICAKHSNVVSRF